MEEQKFSLVANRTQDLRDRLELLPAKIVAKLEGLLLIGALTFLCRPSLITHRTNAPKLNGKGECNKRNGIGFEASDGVGLGTLADDMKIGKDDSR